MPWRETTDPYRIWLSEIILQQTRVEQGTPYYLKFIDKYPDIQSLASAAEQDILKDWQGLGYYSRARNLHAAAKQVVSEFNGEFPENHDDIRSLKGVGEYTAAAIASFAFGLPYAVVDGNVIRLLSRYFGVDSPVDVSSGARIIRELATEVFDHGDPATHNQAIMEFGAIQCIPSSPDCGSCPLKDSCRAFEMGTVNRLPVKSRKQKVSRRYFNYLLVNVNGMVGLQKRKNEDIWKNLFELPLIETPKMTEVSEMVRSGAWASMFKGHNVSVKKVTGPVVHKLSHREIIARFIQVNVPEWPAEVNEILQDVNMVPVGSLGDYPVPRLLENYLQEAIPGYDQETKE